ncbi:MAG: hypothetical protein FWD43_03610 [Coriobacteriia bacterium]|nr:hypothetical protein [Coriobacteriia bacterium]
MGGSESFFCEKGAAEGYSDVQCVTGSLPDAWDAAHGFLYVHGAVGDYPDVQGVTGSFPDAWGAARNSSAVWVGNGKENNRNEPPESWMVYLDDYSLVLLVS